MNILRILILILILGSLPGAVSAYTKTGERLATDGKTGVYALSYAFGHEKYDLALPLYALRSFTPRDGVLTYVVEREESRTESGSSVAIVLSDVPHKDGWYVVPKGTKATFTLLVLYTPAPGEALPYRIQVTSLPFSFVGAANLALNPSELTYYHTDDLILEAR